MGTPTLIRKTRDRLRCPAEAGDCACALQCSAPPADAMDTGAALTSGNDSTKVVPPLVPELSNEAVLLNLTHKTVFSPPEHILCAWQSRSSCSGICAHRASPAQASDTGDDSRRVGMKGREMDIQTVPACSSDVIGSYSWLCHVVYIYNTLTCTMHFGPRLMHFATFPP